MAHVIVEKLSPIARPLPGGKRPFPVMAVFVMMSTMPAVHFIPQTTAFMPPGPPKIALLKSFLALLSIFFVTQSFISCLSQAQYYPNKSY
jgi:hypothetical protein